MFAQDFYIINNISILERKFEYCGATYEFSSLYIRYEISKITLRPKILILIILLIISSHSNTMKILI